MDHEKVNDQQGSLESTAAGITKAQRPSLFPHKQTQVGGDKSSKSEGAVRRSDTDVTSESHVDTAKEQPLEEGRTEEENLQVEPPEPVKEEVVIELDEPHPYVPEEPDNASDMAYMEYVTACFTQALQDTTLDTYKIEQVCAALSDDYESLSLTAITSLLKCTRRTEFVSGKALSWTRRHLVLESLSVMAQFLSQAMLAFMVQIVTLPLALIYSWQTGQTLSNIKAANYSLAENLYNNSASWRPYLHALIAYHFNITVPRNSAHGNILNLSPGPVCWNIEAIQEWTERQRRVLDPHTLTLLTELKSDDPAVELLGDLLKATKAVYIDHKDIFIEDGFKKHLHPDAVNGQSYPGWVLDNWLSIIQHPNEKFAPESHDRTSASVLRNVLLMADHEHLQLVDPETRGRIMPEYNRTCETTIPMMVYEMNKLIEGEHEKLQNPIFVSRFSGTSPLNDLGAYDDILMGGEEAKEYLMNNHLSRNTALQVVLETLFPEKKQRDALDTTRKIVHSIFLGVLSSKIGGMAMKMLFNGGRGLRPSVQMRLTRTLAQAVGIPLPKDGYAGTPCDTQNLYYHVGGFNAPLGNPGLTSDMSRELGRSPILPNGSLLTDTDELAKWLDTVEHEKRTFQAIQDKYTPQVARLFADVQTRAFYPHLMIALFKQCEKVNYTSENPMSISDSYLASVRADGDAFKEPRLDELLRQFGEFVSSHPDYKAFEKVLQFGERDERLATDVLNGEEMAHLSRRYKMPRFFMDESFMYQPIKIPAHITTLHKSKPEIPSSAQREVAFALSTTVVDDDGRPGLHQLESSAMLTIHQQLISKSRTKAVLQDKVFTQIQGQLKAMQEDFTKLAQKQTTVDKSKFLTYINKASTVTPGQMWTPFMRLGDPAEDQKRVSKVDSPILTQFGPFFVGGKQPPLSQLSADTIRDFIKLRTLVQDADFPIIFDGFYKGSGGVAATPTASIEDPDLRKLYCWIICEILRLIISYHVISSIDLDSLRAIQGTDTITTLTGTSIVQYLDALTTDGIPPIEGEDDYTRTSRREHEENLKRLLNILEDVTVLAELRRFEWARQHPIYRANYMLSTTEGQKIALLFAQLVGMAVPYISETVSGWLFDDTEKLPEAGTNAHKYVEARKEIDKMINSEKPTSASIKYTPESIPSGISFDDKKNEPISASLEENRIKGTPFVNDMVGRDSAVDTALRSVPAADQKDKVLQGYISNFFGLLGRFKTVFTSPEVFNVHFDNLKAKLDSAFKGNETKTIQLKAAFKAANDAAIKILLDRELESWTTKLTTAKTEANILQPAFVKFQKENESTYASGQNANAARRGERVAATFSSMKQATVGSLSSATDWWLDVGHAYVATPITELCSRRAFITSLFKNVAKETTGKTNVTATREFSDAIASYIPCYQAGIAVVSLLKLLGVMRKTATGGANPEAVLNIPGWTMIELTSLDTHSLETTPRTRPLIYGDIIPPGVARYRLVQISSPFAYVNKHSMGDLAAKTLIRYSSAGLLGSIEWWVVTMNRMPGILESWMPENIFLAMIVTTLVSFMILVVYNRLLGNKLTKFGLQMYDRVFQSPPVPFPSIQDAYERRLRDHLRPGLVAQVAPRPSLVGRATKSMRAFINSAADGVRAAWLRRRARNPVAPVAVVPQEQQQQQQPPPVPAAGAIPPPPGGP